MSISLPQLDTLINSDEGEHLEFKEAKQNFHFETLVKYCAALANEGGGHMILGVTDKKPRRVVGSQAFSQLRRTKAGIIERLRLRVDVDEIAHPDGRVLVFSVPSRPLGVPVAYRGANWMRRDQDLVPMTNDMLQRIFDEASPDYSAEICEKATLAELDPAAIEDFRCRWIAKSGNQSLAGLSQEQLLRDAELIDNRGVTFAALILLGEHCALGRHLAQSEMVFEYRGTETAGPANQRDEFREGFFLFYDRLWETINLRNDLQHYQDGLFMLDVPTFSEGAMREAILNAVSHRDYRHPGSIFIRQFSQRIEIVSPGGFPPGITIDNILYRQNPRNRRIAETFGRCGLVERAGQGANRMFEETIRQGKRLPDFKHTDQHQVSLTFHGQIQAPEFLRFLKRVSPERDADFTTEDLVVLDLVHREQSIPEELRDHVRLLVDEGIVERIGRGRGVRYLISRKFYELRGETGEHTRKLGLDRDQNKTLLLNHIRRGSSHGTPLRELKQVLPNLSDDQIRHLLRELREAEIVRLQGKGPASRWFVCEE